MTVRKAVIPAAGLGTRFLPATKAQPKEMIPVVDKPGIQWAVEECVRAGISDFLIITSRGKVAIEDHFDRSVELEQSLEKAGKSDELELVRAAAQLGTFHYVRQDSPLGFGHAVLMAKEHVGEESFIVAVPDEIVPEPLAAESELLEEMLKIHEEQKASVIAVQRVEYEEISSYGVINPEPISENVVRIVDMVEKPARDEAPSDLASRGRYLLTAGIFDAIERTSVGVGGEIQLTDAINLLAHEEGVFAYIHNGPIYDVGKKLDYLRSTVELALRRDDLAKPLRRFLTELLAKSPD